MTAMESTSGSPPAVTTDATGGDAPDFASILAAGDAGEVVMDDDMSRCPANPVEIGKLETFASLP